MTITFSDGQRNHRVTTPYDKTDGTSMDLGEDIREFVLNSLPHDPQYTSELRAKTAQELLIIYGNWRSRLVSMGPRQIHCSEALDANPLSNDPRYKPGLDAIISKLKRIPVILKHSLHA